MPGVLYACRPIRADAIVCNLHALFLSSTHMISGRVSQRCILLIIFALNFLRICTCRPAFRFRAALYREIGRLRPWGRQTLQGDLSRRFVCDNMSGVSATAGHSRQATAAVLPSSEPIYLMQVTCRTSAALNNCSRVECHGRCRFP